ncbi:uncharacterized protein LOC130956056 [Arachis stenosperma]|uniref:uncharacterized protein LOC130956056 n=1 Tax=Arachis stenosperma TaxID=217475 RepID=UPI0025ACA54B|nr:uncharacterized protein LOC130956056 [Arachis stenosperma]
MGNYLALCRPISGSCISSNHGNKVVRVAKPDGKVLEFRTPIHVKEILSNFQAFGSVGISKVSSESLSPDYELKPGRLYYLLPSQGVKEQGNNNNNNNNGLKRIKVVITKQQLQQLVTKQISVEDILSEVHLQTVGAHNNRKPKLDCIPEEN